MINDQMQKPKNFKYKRINLQNTTYKKLVEQEWKGGEIVVLGAVGLRAQAVPASSNNSAESARKC